MTAPRKHSKLVELGVILIVAGLYLVVAKLGLSLASLNASVSPVWPPTGVAIALVLWLGYRAVPGVLLGALLANYLLTDVAFLTAAGISMGNTLEAITAVYLVRRFAGSRNPFQRAVDVLKFVVFAAILSTAMMLDHLGCGSAARRIETAVAAALAAGNKTRDLGGNLSTTEMGAAIVAKLTT